MKPFKAAVGKPELAPNQLHDAGYPVQQVSDPLDFL